MEALIAPLQRRLLETLIADPKISVKLLENTGDKEKYKICTIENCGAVTFGKTPFRWWNQLLNCQDVLQFESVALKIWDVLVDCSSGLNNQAILKGLSQEIVMNSVREKNYNWVIDRLFDCWRHVAQLSGGYQKPVAPEGALANDQDGNKVLIEHSGPSQIVIQLEKKSENVDENDSTSYSDFRQRWRFTSYRSRIWYYRSTADSVVCGLIVRTCGIQTN